MKHVHKHKHHYAFGVFGSYAIVKAILLFAGFFGLINLASTFAAGPTATDVAILGDGIVGQVLTGSYALAEGWQSVGTTGFSEGKAYYTSLSVYG